MNDFSTSLNNQVHNALLGKWKCNLLNHQRELWTKVVESKYGGWRGLEEVDRAGFTSSHRSNIRLFNRWENTKIMGGSGTLHGGEHCLTVK